MPPPDMPWSRDLLSLTCRVCRSSVHPPVPPSTRLTLPPSCSAISRSLPARPPLPILPASLCGWVSWTSALSCLPGAPLLPSPFCASRCPPLLSGLTYLRFLCLSTSLPVYLSVVAPACPEPHMSPHSWDQLRGPTWHRDGGSGKTLGFTSDRGRGSPEIPSSGPPPPPPQPVWVTLSLLAGVSEPGMSEESPWRWRQPYGRAEAGRAVEVGSSLVPHPHPQGPSPSQGGPGLRLPLPTSLALTPCLSPPVATVNNLACRGLDKLEEKLPFLQQPSDTVP